MSSYWIRQARQTHFMKEGKEKKKKQEQQIEREKGKRKEKNCRAPPQQQGMWQTLQERVEETISHRTYMRLEGLQGNNWQTEVRKKHPQGKCSSSWYE